MTTKLTWVGRVVSGILGALLLFGGASGTLMRTPEAIEGFRKMGYPAESMMPIGIAALVGAVLYLVPATAVLGAIVLTGYLGGAVATHVQVSDGMWPIAVIFGVLIWLGLYLRDERLRALLPMRRL